MSKLIDADILIKILKSKIDNYEDLAKYDTTEIDRLQILAEVKGYKEAIGCVNTMPPTNTDLSTISKDANVEDFVKSEHSPPIPKNIKVGDFVRFTPKNRMAYVKKIDSNVTSFDKVCPYVIMSAYIGHKCMQFNMSEDRIIKTDLSLEEFKDGKVMIEVDKENIDSCILLLHKLNINWITEPNNYNPYIAHSELKDKPLYLLYDTINNKKHFNKSGIVCYKNCTKDNVKIFKW